MKETMLSIVLWTAIIAITGFALIGFSFVVGKVLTNIETSNCGLVERSTGHCLDGKYEVYHD